MPTLNPPPTPAATSAAPNANATNFNQFMEGILPGYGKLTSTGTSVIGDMLSGLPSPDAARQSNAYFGAGSGMGQGSEFLRNRGYDLYRQQGQQRQQQGLGDLQSFISGVSGPANTYTGQQNQFALGQGNLALGGAQLGEQASEFDKNLAFQNWLQGNKLGLEGAGLGLQGQQNNNNQMNSYLSFLQ